MVMECVLKYVQGKDGCIVQLKKSFGRSKAMTMALNKEDQYRYLHIYDNKGKEGKSITLGIDEMKEMMDIFRHMEDQAIHFRRPLPSLLYPTKTGYMVAVESNSVIEYSHAPLGPKKPEDQIDISFSTPQTNTNSTAPPPPRTTANFMAPLPPQTAATFTAPSPPQTVENFTAPPPPPRTTANFTAPPPPQTTANFTAPPPPQTTTNFTAPPPPQTTENFTAPPPTQTAENFIVPPPPQTAENFILPLPRYRLLQFLDHHHRCRHQQILQHRHHRLPIFHHLHSHILLQHHRLNTLHKTWTSEHQLLISPVPFL